MSYLRCSDRCYRNHLPLLWGSDTQRSKQPAPVAVAQPQQVVNTNNPQQPTRVRKKNLTRTNAIILTLLLGGLGGDYFYIGKTTTGIGVLAAVILTGGFGLIITTIMALVHLIQFISMSDADFDNKYNY